MPKTITLDHITKIEGHASLTVAVKDGKVRTCELGSTEGARFFEGLVRGRNYDDAVEMTMRICGICSVSHYTASIKALENAMGVTVTQQTKTMRDLMAIGERIRSHATHLYFLSLPDFKGYESALAMAPRYKREINDALALMRAGNEIVTALGGRQMHPMGGRIGGFTHEPSRAQIARLIAELKNAEEPALRTLQLFLKLKYPKFTMPREHLSLRQASGFPLITGDIVSDTGEKIPEHDYESYFQEYVSRHSTAKFVVKGKKSFMLGALARVNNNRDLIDKDVQRVLARAGVSFPSKNPFHNLVAQAIELVHWVRRGRTLLAQYRNGFKHETVKVVPCAGNGVGVVEAPRGLLFHTYTVNEKGIVTRANIMTPTCQQLKAMEEDVKAYLQSLLDKGVKRAEIPLELEKLIRAYDPCFSCSTHFLKVHWDGD